MAKDPAMLWYWNDWFSATTLFSRFLKGCYMDILHAQFNNGHLSLEEIKICLGSDFGSSWPALQKKFKQDEIGLFFNERLDQEKEKRRLFTDGRKKNLSKNSHMEPHMKSHMKSRMENENRNENVNEKEKWKTCEKFDLNNSEVQLTIEFIYRLNKKLLSIPDVENSWKAFSIHNEFTESRGRTVKHFRDWLKLQNLSNGTNQPTNSKGSGRNPNARALRQEINQDVATRGTPDFTNQI